VILLKFFFFLRKPLSLKRKKQSKTFRSYRIQWQRNKT